MEVSELDHTVADPLHPGLLPNVLRDESSPDRYRFQRTAQSGSFKPNASRITIAEYAEGVQIPVILDLSADVSNVYDPGDFT